jgi:hypothetical protein
MFRRRSKRRRQSPPPATSAAMARDAAAVALEYLDQRIRVLPREAQERTWEAVIRCVTPLPSRDESDAALVARLAYARGYDDGREGRDQPSAR